MWMSPQIDFKMNKSATQSRKDVDLRAYPKLFKQNLKEINQERYVKI